MKRSFLTGILVLSGLVLSACRGDFPESQVATALPIVSPSIPTPMIAYPAPDTLLPAAPTEAEAPTVPASASPSAEAITWTSLRYPSGGAGSWGEIGYPDTWTAKGPLPHGEVSFAGDYQGHSYELAINYPMPVPDSAGSASLDGWAEEEVSKVPADLRDEVVVEDTIVGGVPAKKLLKMPAVSYGPDGTPIYSETERVHLVLIWSSPPSLSQSVVVIRQSDAQPFDSAALETLLDEFLTRFKQ